MKHRHLLGLKDYPAEDIKSIIDTAFSFKEVLERPIKKVPSLNGKTIVNLFFENSTRTRISFELAQKRLSADTVNFSASTSSLKKGETFKDTAQNLEAMKIDAVVMRHPTPGAPLHLTKHIDAIIINAGDGTHEHPTQAILDMTSLYEKFGYLKGLKIAIIGDILHSRVAISNIYLLKKIGAEVMICGPSTLIPKYINDFGIIIENDINKALKWCDVANVLRIQLERQNINFFPSLREYSLYFGINKKLLDKINKDIIIMHPGPINRGIEINSDVADSKNSIILDQVENGVAIRMAVMYLLSLNKNE